MLISQILPSETDYLKKYECTRGISKLYDWQTQLLSDRSLMKERRNFVLSLPTGAGKSLIAEVLMLREAMLHRRNCILILPFVAIVQEKIVSLAHFESEFGIVVEEYSGSKGRFPPIRRRGAPSFYIGTIEKINILVNSLISLNQMNEVGLIIVDELHMLGESQRGATLEQCLSKLLNYRGAGIIEQNSLQIVGMSATLSNTEQILRFLRAKLFSTNFRPVCLTERVKIGPVLYRINSQTGAFEEELQLSNCIDKRDPDGITRLMDSIVPHGSVVIFCPTRQGCQNLCKLLASLVPQKIRDHRAVERKTLLLQLMDEHEEQVCSILQYGIAAGVAYHHSGLTNDERVLIESGYKSGIISVICATSTLAAGVNLPARRVIPYLGRDPIRKSHYLQMVGRAGRAGLDHKGDSIVILKPGREVDAFKEMITGPLEPCQSFLRNEAILESFVLELISLQICSTNKSLHSVVGSSLYGIQMDDDTTLEHIVDHVVQNLVARKMVSIEENNVVRFTQLGSAAFHANFCPQRADEMRRSLKQIIGQGLVLSSHFHLLYTIVPCDVEVSIDWNLFHREYVALSIEERRIIHSMSLPEAVIVQLIVSGRQKVNGSTQPNEIKRIYVAFMLRRIWLQEPIWQVSKRFDVSRGWLQQSLQSACSNSSAVVRFAEKTPELWSLRSLLPEMVKRLSECRQQELISLLSIDCIKQGRAQMLYKKGFRTVGSIANSTHADLISSLEGKLSVFQARRMITSAKSIIRDQVAEKMEELEMLGASCDLGIRADSGTSAGS